MPTYREHLARSRAEIERDRLAPLSDALAGDSPPLFDRRPRAGRVGRGAHPERRPHPARPPRVAHRAHRARPRRADRHLLRLPATARPSRRRRSRSSATSTSARTRRGYHGLEARRLPDRRSRAALEPEQRRRYSRHLLIPEVGEDGAAEAARLARAADRRRRPRLARVALPRSRRRRHARHRRRRRRRRDEPPAPDRPLDRAPRRAEGALGGRDDRGAEPGRQRRASSRSA